MNIVIAIILILLALPMVGVIGFLLVDFALYFARLIKHRKRTMITIEEFNSHKVSEEFLQKCKKAKELFR